MITSLAVHNLSTFLLNTYCLLNEKKALKNLVQGPDVQKTFRLSSQTPGYS